MAPQHARRPAALPAMLDVDQFKPITTPTGTSTATVASKQIAEACMDVISRPGDLVARFGGEEFVVPAEYGERGRPAGCQRDLHITAQPRIAAYWQPIRNHHYFHRLRHADSPGRHARPGPIAMADHALYTAKHNGRTRFVEQRAGKTRGTTVS